MSEAGGSNLAINVSLQLKVCRRGVAVSVQRERHIHFGNLHLHSQGGEAADVCRNGIDIRMEVADVHLEAHAMDGHAAVPEISHHSVDFVRLRVHRLGFGVVVEKKCVRIGRMRPAKAVLNIGVAFVYPADSGLVIPDGAA